jgi:hypothetical protein
MYIQFNLDTGQSECIAERVLYDSSDIFWAKAPEGFNPKADVCFLRTLPTYHPVILSYAENETLKAQDECLSNLSKQLTYEAVQKSIKESFDFNLHLYTEETVKDIKAVLISKLKQDRDAFVETGFNYLCKYDEQVHNFQADTLDGLSIQSSFIYRSAHPKLVTPELVTDVKDIELPMELNEFYSLYDSLAHFIRKRNQSYKSVRSKIIKAEFTQTDLLQISAPNYIEATLHIPRSFITKEDLIRLKQANTLKNYRFLGWLNSVIGDGGPTKTEELTNESIINT